MTSGIRSARRLVPSEAQVKKAVCDWLDAKRIRYHRLNAGATVAGEGKSRRFIRMAEPGTPDLLVIAALKWTGAAKFCAFPPCDHCGSTQYPVYVELKAPGKGPGPAQREWHERARRDGLDVFVCHSVEEVAAALGLKA